MTTSPRLKPVERFTYSDYLTWSDDERWELIDGVAYAMSPAPSRKHQEIFGNLHAVFHQYLKGKKCKVYGALFDVRLPNNAGAADEDLSLIHI